jgi:DNA modification methylase
MHNPVPTNEILLGACEDILRTLPDACVDSIVTDPPYGLGTREPTAQDIELYLAGKALDTGGDFMGKAWEIPSVPTWRECYRVLKPGGYVLSFAGTRTWDIMSVGLRAAGFENRDTISSLFGSPCFCWVHSQGFPKSTNISKKLRERATKKGVTEEETARLNKLADLFEGYGTALKPAWEPVLCFRKPIIEPTLADQVASTGTGGINIDGARVKHASVEDLQSHQAMVAAIKARGGSMQDSWKNSSDLAGANDVKTEGRWPPNLTLTHSPECKQVGTRKVPAPTINRFTDGMKPFGDGAGHPYESSGGGEEEVPIYECVEGCPVRALNAQSGDLPAPGNITLSDRTPTDQGFTRGGAGGVRPVLPKDASGASKFFPQFVPDAPFYYTGKASKREKNSGIERGTAKASNRKGERIVRLRDEELTPDEKRRLVINWPPEREKVDPREPQPEWAIPEAIRDLFVMARPDDNVHPTVKPVNLMAWLVGLVTPKGGLVLDPYCGSGTTCVGALEKGCNYLAIEKDSMYLQIAERRLTALKEKVLPNRELASACDALFANMPDEE